MSGRRIVQLGVAGAAAAGFLAVTGYLTNRTPGPEAKAPAHGQARQDPVHERKALEAELKKKPGHAPILFRLAELAREGAKPAEAVAYLREILKAEPNNTEALLELGRALYESGDIGGALAETKRLVEIDPDNTDGLYNLGAIYGNLNQPEMARKYFARAVQAGPESNGGRLARDALARLGR